MKTRLVVCRHIAGRASPKHTQGIRGQLQACRLMLCTCTITEAWTSCQWYPIDFSVAKAVEQTTGNHSCFHCVADTDSPSSSLFLTISMSQLCQSLGRVKLKCILCAVFKGWGSWLLSPPSLSWWGEHIAGSPLLDPSNASWEMGWCRHNDVFFLPFVGSYSQLMPPSVLFSFLKWTLELSQSFCVHSGSLLRDRGWGLLFAVLVTVLPVCILWSPLIFTTPFFQRTGRRKQGTSALAC